MRARSFRIRGERAWLFWPLLDWLRRELDRMPPVLERRQDGGEVLEVTIVRRPALPAHPADSWMRP